MINCERNEVQIGVTTPHALEAAAEVMSDVTQILRACRQWLTRQTGLPNEYVNELFVHALTYSDMTGEELEKANEEIEEIIKEGNKDGDPV